MFSYLKKAQFVRKFCAQGLKNEYLGFNIGLSLNEFFDTVFKKKNNLLINGYSYLTGMEYSVELDPEYCFFEENNKIISYKNSFELDNEDSFCMFIYKNSSETHLIYVDFDVKLTYGNINWFNPINIKSFYGSFSKEEKISVREFQEKFPIEYDIYCDFFEKNTNFALKKMN